MTNRGQCTWLSGSKTALKCKENVWWWVRMGCDFSESLGKDGVLTITQTIILNVFWILVGLLGSVATDTKYHRVTQCRIMTMEPSSCSRSFKFCKFAVFLKIIHSSALVGLSKYLIKNYKLISNVCVFKEGKYSH